MTRGLSPHGILRAMRRAVLWMAPVSCIVSVNLVWMLVYPSVALARALPDPEPWTSPPPVPAELLLSRSLRETAERIERLADPAAAGAESIAARRNQLAVLDRAVRQELERMGREIEARGYPEEIRRRHEQAAASYGFASGALQRQLEEVAASEPGAERRAALDAALANLRSGPLERPHQALDPENLPFARVPLGERSPRLSDEAYGGGAGAAAPRRVAAAASAPRPEDLQADEDVQITPEIEALAASLGDDPLALYRWVHDHVAFVPTYGSAQGSAMTLLSRRGNAFDTAALLVALLRAAGVPARFVQGTAELPSARVMNWLGGAETPQMAQQVLGQGGIPNVGVLRGSELTHVRVEHVWVEAFVDYVPSRGARRDDAPDTWVPLDASFKQHLFTPPAGLYEAQPFDVAALQADLLAAGDYDPSLERIANLDEELIRQAFDAWEEEAGDFFASEGVGPTRDALLGKREIVPAVETVLPASLPYRVLASAAPVATLPASARLGVTLRGYPSAIARALGDPAFTVDLSLPRLNSRRLSLTWVPATAADAQVLDDARNGGAASLPLYLVSVRPVVELDDQVLATAPAVPMGSGYFVDVVLRDVGDSATVPYEVVAGDESVIGVDAQGIVPEVVERRLADVPTQTAKENLHQTGLNFWMESDLFAELAAESLGVRFQRRLSVGLFASPLTVSYLFGVPRSGVYQSRIMDVKRSLVGVAAEDPALATTFLKESGKLTSFLEGLVHDQLFSTDAVARGFSAMEFLGDANSRGIATYYVTAANLSQVLPRLEVSSAVRNDVANSVAAGKSVLIPEREFDRGSWRGIGYIVQDEATGAGAYLISGGLNGGGWLDCLPDLSPLLDILLAIIIAAIIIAMIIAIIKSFGLLAPVLKPAIVAMIALIAVLVGTSPAYAGGFRGGGRADPCNCPPPQPPPPCQFHVDHTHFPCVTPPDHWHYFTVNQGPAPACIERVSRHFGGCGPPQVPPC